jgi:hypothetical protein
VVNSDVSEELSAFIFKKLNPLPPQIQQSGTSTPKVGAGHEVSTDSVDGTSSRLLILTEFLHHPLVKLIQTTFTKNLLSE